MAWAQRAEHARVRILTAVVLALEIGWILIRDRVGRRPRL